MVSTSPCRWVIKVVGSVDVVVAAGAAIKKVHYCSAVNKPGRVGERVMALIPSAAEHRNVVSDMLHREAECVWVRLGSGHASYAILAISR